MLIEVEKGEYERVLDLRLVSLTAKLTLSIFWFEEKGRLFFLYTLLGLVGVARRKSANPKLV